MTEQPVHDAVAALWERFRPLVSSRIETLERFAEGDPRLGAGEAARAAHNLAGALGSYGRHDGSRTARRIEQALRADTPLPEAWLRNEVARLRAEVQ
ncbi:hypothetical protein GMA12_10920 [Kocuria sediminis]|uniref:HPt domain-containing protein n=1 Tax=Kocuria sediminis TaxID=1038857 RepID=A0A6N8GKL9_9MICC|nr:Hpt domain-containing protein [Kocuria sediminis]MUN63651.1 hypothetical protein [Kocuria sediminis]